MRYMLIQIAMKITIECAENGFIVSQPSEKKRIYRTEAELMAREFSYLFEVMAEQGGEVTVNIVVEEK